MENLHATPAPSAAASASPWWSLVAQLWSGGASAHSIAGALNRAGIAPPSGTQWHFRHVARLLSPLQDTTTMRPLHPLATLSSAHLRDEVLNALGAQAADEAALRTRIGLHLQAGSSSATIAARLNRSGARTPSGTRWTARSVDALLDGTLAGIVSGQEGRIAV